ncbi:hypothetical protein CCACVL1_15557 [Corchorus capsularis]|uniref:Reverse transcriptase zinc-binding domain-containing protein n=1 Tax=Corchorus capsularis TaxID=210143 RepID=A0A1R3I1S3_COCAP|nr:hypothetical protein CCACVL1_15557 [Corchorus capsularis]
MDVVTLEANLKSMVPYMWRYIEYGRKCACLRDIPKTLFGRLAKELNERHEARTFCVNLSDQNILFDQYGACEAITFPQFIKVDSTMEIAKGIYKDLDAFVKIFISFVSNHKPQSSDKEDIKFPAEIRYFLCIWEERARIVPDEDNPSFDQVRQLEFWIFNAPVFLERGRMKAYLFKIYNFWERYEQNFLNHVSLTTGDNEFSEWGKRLESSKVMDYYDRDNSDEIYQAYDDQLKVIKEVYDYGIKNHKAKHYDEAIGVVEFALNCFEHVKEKQNAVLLEYFLHAIFPELFGKIHHELFLWEPKVVVGVFDLYEELSRGVTTYYQSGLQAHKRRQQKVIWHRLIWFSVMSLVKHAFISWLAILIRLPTKDKLLKWGVSLQENLCPLCHQFLETRDHMLFSCSFSYEVGCIF